jgi:hypothetical protein
MKKTASSTRGRSAPPGVPIKKVKIIIIDKDTLEENQFRTLGDLCDTEADVGFRQIFRHAPGATFTFEGNYPDKVFENARSWLEPSTPQTQCGNVIPDWRKEDPCYICGLPFGRDPENSPECEHILPVFQASCFLTLYKSEYGRKPTADVYKTMTGKVERDRIRNQWREMDMEYAWAHRCCNQLKSDWSFLKYNNKNGIFEFDEKTCKILLDSIAKGRNLFAKDATKSRDYCNSIVNVLKGQSYKTWLNARIQSIFERQIQPICSYLNTSKKDALPGLYYLSIVSNVINATDAKFRNAAIAEAAGSAQLVPPPPEESIFKAGVYMEVATSIANVMLSSGKNWDLKAAEGRGSKKFFIQYMNILFPRSKELLDIAEVASSSGFTTIDKTKMIGVIMDAILTMNKPRSTALFVSDEKEPFSDFTADTFVRDIVSLAPVVEASFVTYAVDREKYEKQKKLYTLVSHGLQCLIYLNIFKNIQRLVSVDAANGLGVAGLRGFVESRIVDSMTALNSTPRVSLLTSYLLSKIDTTFSDPAVDFQDIPELVNNNIIRTRYEYWREQIDKHVKTADEMAMTVSNLASVSIDKLVALSEANVDEIMADDDIAVKPSPKEIVNDTLIDAFRELGNEDVSKEDVFAISDEILHASGILLRTKEDPETVARTSVLSRPVAGVPGQFPEGQGWKRPSMMGKGSKKKNPRTKKTPRRNRKTRIYNT